MADSYLKPLNNQAKYKDKKGNFSTRDDKIISSKSLKGKWKNDKCLISSKKN